jgi:hypothetical protein
MLLMLLAVSGHDVILVAAAVVVDEAAIVVVDVVNIFDPATFDVVAAAVHAVAVVVAQFASAVLVVVI